MPIGFNHNSHNINQSEEIVLQTGNIFGSARSSTPTGYLLCDGSAISRTTYANLFNAIGTSFGIGDGNTTFNIPDGRGGVLRGAGTSVNYAQNVTVTLGVKDDDAMQRITGHLQHVSGGSVFEPAGSGSFYGSNNTWYAQLHVAGGGVYPNIIYLDSARQTRTTNETKMKNVGVNFFIKF